MTTRTLSMSAFSVQSAKPNYAYGQLALPPLRTGQKALLVRAAIPTDIPKNAVVLSAKVRVTTTTSMPAAGGVRLELRRNLAVLRSTATWNNAPTYSGTLSGSLEKINPGPSAWEIDVTSDVQMFVSGWARNLGWRLSTDHTVTFYMRGATAPVNRPVLIIDYAVPGGRPTDLMPAGGAVATDEPTLTFTVPDDTVAVQVQVDPDADGVAPLFDSGEVVSTGGLVDLAATAYAPGWVGGESTQWRARYKHSSLGWGAWSSWVSYSYQPQGTVTIVTPTATPSDLSPTVSWTFSGAQTSWRVRLLSASNKVLADSGNRAGTDTAWEPPTGFKSNGDTGTIEVRVRDDLERIGVAGHPAAAIATLGVTITADGTVPPMAALTAAFDGLTPLVTLTGTRSEIPDEVIIFRNGDRVARLDGTEVFTGTAFSWVDTTAPTNRELTYRVAPVVAGKVAAGGPVATVTLTCQGVWLLDPDTGDAAVIWGTDEGTWEQPDMAVVHQAISGRMIRRRLGRSPLSGTITGTVGTAAGVNAEDVIETLEGFAEADAGQVFRMVAGHLNIGVNIGDVTVAPTPLSNRANGMIATASWAFWEVS